MSAAQKESILVIEDEGKIAEIVRAYLEREGFAVTLASTGEEALRLLKDRFDLVVLDLMLPDMQGEDICSFIRKNSDLPVIMLTAKSAEEERIRGLGIGADDYVIKPFSPRELVARVKALLRRTNKTRKKVYSYNTGSLKISIDDREVFVQGKQMVLTPTEFKILTAFVENPGRIFSRDQLATIAQGFDFEGYDRTI